MVIPGLAKTAEVVKEGEVSLYITLIEKELVRLENLVGGLRERVGVVLSASPA